VRKRIRVLRKLYIINNDYVNQFNMALVLIAMGKTQGSCCIFGEDT
jgi:hypothetical protein